MEIKAILQKPCGTKEKMDFIVEQNHKNGYTIKETETVLEAWGYTEEEKQEQEREQRNHEIDNKIKELREMSLIDIMNNNEENIKLYNDVILGLEESRP